MVRASFLGRVVGCLAPWVLVLGCGGSDGSATPDRTAESLPELGDYLPPLDNGRVEVAPPAGWYVPSRDSRFVARFTPSPDASYPSILLTAKDHQGIAEVTRENVDEFVREVDAALAGGLGGSPATSPARAEAVVSGPFVGATYRKRANVKADMATRTVDRLIVETVAAGRKYRLELRAEQGTVDRYRGDLLAVAAGIRFLGREPGKPSAAAPAAKQAPEEASKEASKEPDAAQSAQVKTKSEAKGEPEVKQARKSKRESMFEEIEEE